MSAITARIPVHSAKTPQRAALIFEGQRLLWSELHRNVDRLAAHIASQTPPGGGIALDLPNGAALALLFLAAAAAGREAQVLDPQWPPAILDATLAALAPSMIVTADQRLASRQDVTLLSSPVIPFDRVAAAMGAPQHYTPLPAPDAHLPFYAGFTSGSTGQPKGYRRNHRSWLESFNADAREFGIHSGDVVLAPGALSHSLFLYALANGLHAGATVVFCSKFRPPSIPELIHKHCVSVLYGVPTHLRLVLEAAISAGVAPMHSVRWVLSSGAKWFADAAPDLRRQFPASRFAEFYGASELSFVAVAKDDEPVPENSVGRAFSGVALTIRDRRGKRLPPGRRGRVFAESPFLFSGYAVGGEGDLHRAKQALSVGDTGYLDANGFLHLVGREKRMIVTSGKNVFPEEIERELERHGSVAQAAVFGMPDAKRGERLVALLALRPGATLTRAAIIAHARTALPLYKVPRVYGVAPAWMWTASGKSDFEGLRREWSAGTHEGLA